MDEMKKDLTENEVINTGNNAEIENKKETEQKQTGLGIASLILGIIAVMLWCAIPISTICGILAIIFGAISKNKEDNAMPKVGLILGIISVIISVAFSLLWILRVIISFLLYV